MVVFEGYPPHPVEPFLEVRKIKNLRLRLSDAESSPGYHITPPYVRVPGADGTTVWGWRVRGRDIFTISCFDLRRRQRYRARDTELQKMLRFSDIERALLGDSPSANF